jgi:hypothetical protein
MDEVAAAAAAAPEEDLLPTTERERQQALGRLIAIAEVSPRAAILEAWLEVERQLARQHGPKEPNWRSRPASRWLV